MKSKSNDSQLLAEAYEDLFKSRFITEEDEGGEEKEEKDEPKEEKEEKSEGSEEKSEGDSEEKSEGESEEKSSSPFGPNKSDESDEEDSEEGGEEGEEGEGFGGGEEGSEIKNKVEKLQKQYNDILIDAFDKYASECIESALSSVKSSFGENIEGILDDALKQLKDKIMGDLGVEGAMNAMGQLGGMDVDMGDDHGVEFGANVGGVPTISVTGDQSEVEDEANPSHEAGETPEQEAEERVTGEEDEEVQETFDATRKFPGAFKKKVKGKKEDKKDDKKDKKEESLSECVANFYNMRK